MTSLLPTPEVQFIDENGAPYAGGTIAFYIPGTLTPKSTWQDALQVTLNTNPVVLDAAGRAIIFGDGDYRAILKDALGNEIYDQLTSSTLPESDISPAMLPVVEAATLATARNLMGITAAIAAAIAAVQLLPGPQGATGATGPAGPQGGTGATGTASINTAYGDASSAGMYWKDLASGWMMASGQGNTGPSGTATVYFPLAFANAPNVVACTVGNGTNMVLRVYGMVNDHFWVFIEDTDNHGGQSSQFSWNASGF